MLEIISGLPAHVLGVRARGAIGKKDMKDVLLPALQKQIDHFDELNYLLILDTRVGCFTAGAWLQDLKAGIKHLTKWKKIAVVTDQRAVEFFSDAFTIAVRGTSKGFSRDQEAEARKWVSAED